MGWEGRPTPFSSNLKCNSSDSQHSPHGQDDVVVGLERHSDESPSKIRVESSPEDVQSDVGEAREHVTVNGQHHGVGAHYSTSQDVQYPQAAKEDDWNKQSYAGERHPEHSIIMKDI